MTQPSTNPDPSPVCPRHPDRVTYVRCQRCDRPTCPQCQVPSAVGVHCVDCARRNASSRRGVSSLLGGRAITDALVTKGLIIACVTIYLVQMALPSLGAQFAFVPAVASSQPWRFMTTAFLHASLMHLAFNMWALWVLGSALEPILGRWRFAALCALSALGGSTMIYWLASPTAPASWLTSTVGASGAVLAALYAWAPRNRRTVYGVCGTVGITIALIGVICLRAALA